MKFIYNNNGIQIKKNKDAFTFNFSNYKYKDSYIKSLFKEFKILKDEINEKKNIRIIEIKAHSIETLTELLKIKENKLSYLNLKLLFLQGKKLLTSLKKDNLGVLNFNIEDFIIVNKEHTRRDSKFMFLNQSKFTPLVNDNINIEHVINKKDLFLSNELIEIKSLPTTITDKSSMFSLGLILCHCLNPFDKKEFNSEDLKRFDNGEDKFNSMIKKHLESILNSKLYWAILRVLEINPNDRYLIWI